MQRCSLRWTEFFTCKSVSRVISRKAKEIRFFILYRVVGVSLYTISLTWRHKKNQKESGSSNLSCLCTFRPAIGLFPHCYDLWFHYADITYWLLHQVLYLLINLPVHLYERFCMLHHSSERQKTLSNYISTNTTSLNIERPSILTMSFVH